MRNSRDPKTLFADRAGSLLEREDVEWLAECNMGDDREALKSLAALGDYDLVQWATNAEGLFDTDVMYEFDIEFATEAPGDEVYRGFEKA